MNEFYQDSGTPATGAAGSSSPVRAEFAAIELGFDKLPTLTGNGNELVKINSTGTGMTSSDAWKIDSSDNLVRGADPGVLGTNTSVFRATNGSFYFKQVAETYYGIIHGVNVSTGLTVVAEGAAGFAGLDMVYHGTASSGQAMTFLRGRGTVAAPLVAVISGDQLGTIEFWGIDGVSSAKGAFHRVIAVANWSASSHPTKIEFSTTAVGNTTPAKVLVLADSADGSGFVEVNNSAGGTASLLSNGTATNVNLNLMTKGSGQFGFYTGDWSLLQAMILHVASAVNFLTFAGAATGNAARVVASGGDTNVGLSLESQAAGNVILQPNTGDIRWGKALVTLGGGATPTFGTIGGSGPAAAAQNTWMRVLDSAGVAFWVPAWK